jgi:hypothetical protein
VDSSSLSIFLFILPLLNYSSQLRTNSYFQCLLQEQNNIFLLCQLGNSIFQPFVYKSDVLTSRLSATPKVCQYYTLLDFLIKSVHNMSVYDQIRLGNYIQEFSRKLSFMNNYLFSRQLLDQGIPADTVSLAVC